MSGPYIEKLPFYPLNDIDDANAQAVRRTLEYSDLYALHETETSLLHGIGHASISLTVRGYLEQLNTMDAESCSNMFSEGFGAYEVIASLVKSPHASTRASVVRESRAVLHRLNAGDVLDILSEVVHQTENTHARTLKLLAETARLYKLPDEGYFIAGGSVALQVDTAARFPEF
ncbi:MAG TPA: hypothetical protein VFH06_04690 [Candidatus Saccharimonadales bacterium]|nr:hypothetical protein [Candidatus Saccharimonadales bacterium]